MVMPLSPETMRILLAACIVAMALLAILYLRRRELSTPEHIACGLLILLPLLGPFLVILASPRRTSPGVVPLGQAQVFVEYLIP